MKSTNLITITSAVALLLNTSCTKAQTNDTPKAPPAAETSKKLDVPPEEIIKKGAVLVESMNGGQMTSYKFGATMVSTGGLIPEGTTLYPVRMEFHYGKDIMKGDVYFFQDEFGEWKYNLKGRSEIISVK